MTVFALVIEGKVAQIEPAEFQVHESWTWVDVSDLSPTPEIGWDYVDGAFIEPPPPPPPPLPRQAFLASQASLTITGDDAALAGTYAVDPMTRDHLQAELLALLMSDGKTFADGTDSVAWADMTGTSHRLSVTQFKALAQAVTGYVAALHKVMVGTLTTLPPNTVKLG